MLESVSLTSVPEILTELTVLAAEFTSTELNSWCSKNGIEKMESPPTALLREQSKLLKEV